MCRRFHRFLLLEESKVLVIKKIYTQLPKFIYICFAFYFAFLSLGKSFAYEAKEDYFFEVQFGNIIVGKAEVSVINDEKKIIVKAKTKTSGFLNTFYEYQGELISYGSETLSRFDSSVATASPRPRRQPSTGIRSKSSPALMSCSATTDRSVPSHGNVAQRSSLVLQSPFNWSRIDCARAAPSGDIVAACSAASNMDAAVVPRMLQCAALGCRDN